MILTPEQQEVVSAIVSIQESIPDLFTSSNDGLKTITQLRQWLSQIKRGTFNPEDFASNLGKNVTSPLENAFQSLEKGSIRSPEDVQKKMAALKPLLDVELQPQFKATCNKLEQVMQQLFLTAQVRLNAVKSMVSTFISQPKYSDRAVIAFFEELDEKVWRLLNMLSEAIDSAKSTARAHVRQLGETYCGFVESQ